MLPVFAPRGLTMAGVHSEALAQHAVYLSERENLSTVMVFDLELQIPRHYRVTGSNFPLHIIVDPDGNAVFVDNTPGLEVMTEALDRILPPLP